MASDAAKLAEELHGHIDDSDAILCMHLPMKKWKVILSALRTAAAGEAEPRKRCPECHGILSIHDMRSSTDIGCNCLSRRMKSKD